ncbi:sensor histidine kinase [Paraglaciecola arctica]|uniref:sensor histidine kinase n=1 Tax=Paraglaciecola arctica TaxID=1128911 RepID=UPI001C068F86|nr:histidine kinase [Paraglaciecola arctica]MBU3004296.1 histidine kinase [Paraglaciecola arctica]
MLQKMLLQKLKPIFSLDMFSAVGTWAVVSFSACYFMLVSDRFDLGSVLITACLHLTFISLWLLSTETFINNFSRTFRIALLTTQYACVIGLYFLVPYNYSAILITIWCTLLPTVISMRLAVLSAPLWSAPLWLIYQYYWNEEYALMSAVLFFMFNIFALIMVNTANKERQAKEHANQLNRQLLATQKLLSQANKQAERVRIARNIHDLLGHHLTALTINLQVASRISQGEAKEKIETCHGLAKLLLSDVREAVSEIREKSNIELKDALLALCDNLPGLKIQFEFDDNVKINEVNTADTIIKCVQESLTNTVKHSTADRLQLDIKQLEQAIAVNICDNGQPIKHLKVGNGLRGMAERLALIGGEVSFAHNVNGFCTSITVPQEVQ